MSAVSPVFKAGEDAIMVNVNAACCREETDASGEQRPDQSSLHFDISLPFRSPAKKANGRGREA